MDCNTLYFGYGTFLDDAELDYYLPGAVKVARARAANKILAFHAHEGMKNRGYCHLSDRIDAMGGFTWGILARHDERYFVDYDGFERCFLTVYGDDGGTYDCWTLRMTKPGLAVRPPTYYWDHILSGLKAYNFAPGYTETIVKRYEDALPAEDPDAADPKH